MVKKARSGIDQWHRLQRMRQQYFKQRLKPPWMCPWCFNESMVAVDKEEVWFIYCPKCDKGEVLPKHPVWTSLDCYCMLCDNVEKGIVPIFRFGSMELETFRVLVKLVTLGEIAVERTIQRTETESK